MHFRKLVTSGEIVLLNEVNIKRKRTSTLKELNNLISLKVLTSSGVLLSLLAFNILMCRCFGRYSFSFQILIMCEIASGFLGLHIFDVPVAIP